MYHIHSRHSCMFAEYMDQVRTISLELDICVQICFSFLAFSFGAESLYSLNFGFHICKMNTHYYLPGLFGGFMINKLLEIFVYTCCLQLLTSHSLLTHPYQTVPTTPSKLLLLGSHMTSTLLNPMVRSQSSSYLTY